MRERRSAGCWLASSVILRSMCPAVRSTRGLPGEAQSPSSTVCRRRFPQMPEELAAQHEADLGVSIAGVAKTYRTRTRTTHVLDEMTRPAINLELMRVWAMQFYPIQHIIKYINSRYKVLSRALLLTSSCTLTCDFTFLADCEKVSFETFNPAVLGSSPRGAPTTLIPPTDRSEPRGAHGH